MKSMEQAFIIDKLTDSIVNTISGDRFQTEIATLAKPDLRHILKKNGWNFNWETEFNDLKKEVYKLHVINNARVIQGLISISVGSDHVFMNLVESAPFNVGKAKLYEGVAGNLVAFACKLSFQRGLDGFVAFDAKTKLIRHYEEALGAVRFKDRRMIIATNAAKKLVNRYFKNE